MREHDRAQVRGGVRERGPHLRHGLVGQQHHERVRTGERLARRGDLEAVRSRARLGAKPRSRRDAHLLAGVTQVARVRLALIAVAQHHHGAER